MFKEARMPFYKRESHQDQKAAKCIKIYEKKFKKKKKKIGIKVYKTLQDKANKNAKIKISLTLMKIIVIVSNLQL